MYRNTHATVGQNQGHVSPLSVVRCQWQRTTDDGPRTSSSLPLPPSPFRLGLSLTEVLIAMGILTIGLLGVASVFPVGSFYMQKGEIADRGSAIAQAAFNDALVRGYLNPENWRTWEDAHSSNQLSSGAARPTPLRNNWYTRRLAEAMRRQAAHQAANPPATVAAREWQNGIEFGDVFMIDPLAVGSVMYYGTATPRLNVYAAVFPASRVMTGGIPATAPVCWAPWKDSSLTNGQGPAWPIRRVTFAENLVPPPTSPTVITYTSLKPETARHLFASVDDLSLDPPNAQDKPTVQPWRMVDADNDGERDDPLSRMSRGNYSWAITVSPGTAEAREALATGVGGHSYEVSTVVFYRRPVASLAPNSADERESNADLLQQNERAVNAKIVSTGLSGGQVLLSRYEPDAEGIEPEESPFNILKTGNWVMLCGPHPNSTRERPMLVARWYKVLSIEGKDERLNEQGNTQPAPPASDPERRLVSLRGPNWPWEPAPNLTGYESHPSNALYVCIPAGAVAVHSKTIRLEGNSVHNGGVNALTSK